MPDVMEPNANPITRPLDRLRGLIRRYVLLDGLLTAALFAIIWFWLGLVADYGLFKATHFDWVLDAPKMLRVLALAALTGLLLSLLITRLWLRLRRELSETSLALLLEKRFPGVLGDKLITAVELADVPRAKAAGFSEDLLRATIAEASRRVATVPVQAVFNWQRLRTKSILLVLFALGTLAVVFAGCALVQGSAAPRRFFQSFGDIALIWAERNLLLRNTPWPRQAHLELIHFPSTGELRVGKDAAAPKISARAFRWVVADRHSEQGWRPMLMADVVQFLDPAGRLNVELDATGPDHAGPDGGSQKDAGGQADKPVGGRQDDGGQVRSYQDGWQVLASWDVDRVEARLGHQPDIQAMLARLEAAAADPANSRRLRKLALPDVVTLTYSGAKTSGRFTLNREEYSLFRGEVAGLKESVRFVVKGLDFATRPRSITLVPPPMFLKLIRQERQPAYLHHPPPVTDAVGADFFLLKGLRQTMMDKELSLTGDKSVFSIVQGTEFTLRGVADKPLACIRLKPRIGLLPGQRDSADEVRLQPVGADHREFLIDFAGHDRPSSNTEFEIELEDDDGVKASRLVLVQLQEDQAPQVDVAVDVLRKQGNFFLATPLAMVPFITDSKVRDDQALARVDFLVRVTKVESPAVVAVQSQALAGVLAWAPLAPTIAAAYVPAASAVFAQSMIQPAPTESASVMVGKFAEQFAGLRRETPASLQARLAAPADAESPQIIREVRLQNQTADVFDLKTALPQLSERIETGEFAQRYRVDLAVQATDANVETGPKIGRNLEPIQLLVIAEADLLIEISRDEEAQAARLDEVLKKLRDAQSKLAQLADRLLPLSQPPEVLTAAAIRAQDIAQDLAKCREITAGVQAEYRRLYREAEFNRVRAEILNRYDQEIIQPLETILTQRFAASLEAHEQVQLALGENRRPEDADMAADRFALTQLITDLTLLREKLGEAVSLSKLRADLSALRDRQLSIGRVLRLFKQQLLDELYKPELASIPTIELAPGESRTIKHPINWRLYNGGPLSVRLEGPGANILQVPESIQVADDREEFEYTLIAGNEPGDYRITLIPTAGATVVVKVTIK